MLRNKPVQVMMVLLLTVAIVLSGTFAWNSFNQSRINVFQELMTPDTNLHDDFAGGPNKDVYVENSGTADIFVRVRLTEFLQTEKRGSMVRGHLRDDDKAKFWAPHNALVHNLDDSSVAIDDCRLISPDVTDTPWIGADGAETFHDYYKWIMGGVEKPTSEIYYKPATPEQKGQYNTDGTVVAEPQVVSDPLTETSEQGDAHLAYKAQVEALMAEGKTEAEAMTELGIAKTLTAGVMTMSQWQAGSGTQGEEGYRAPYAMGNYWVIDEADGWCYWAGPLEGQSATGLLLDKVQRTEKKFDSNAEYCVNVWLQAVDETDMGQFEVAGNGGITDNGKRLMQLATGSVVMSADGLYSNNGDGTYTKVEELNGTPVMNAKPFIGLGVNADGSPIGANAGADSRIEIGQLFTITELSWNGVDYENYDSLNAANNGWYNLTKSSVNDNTLDGGKQIYSLAGVEVGRDGKQYLKIQPIINNESSYEPDPNTTMYIASVLRSGELNDYSYTQGNPGAAPFGFIYPDANGLLGTAESTRFDPSVSFDTRHFYHIGNGVYVEVARKGDTVSKDDPVKYFFAGQTVTSAVISGAQGETDEKVNSVFPLQLAVGSKFNVTFGEATGDPLRIPVTGYAAALEGAYTMPELTKGVDGRYYIYLGDSRTGYIEPGTDGFLGDTTKGDLRRWAGNMGIGSDSDKVTLPADLNESFLTKNGITQSEDLAVGKEFKANGYDWIVLGIDEYGNRLIMSKQTIASMGARMSANVDTPAYENTLWPARATAFMNTLTDLKPYTTGAVLPSEPEYKNKIPWADIPAGDGLSTANNSGVPLTFPLSAGEYRDYVVNSDILTTEQKTEYNAGTWGLRSRYTVYATSVSNGQPWDAYAGSPYPPRMAMWIRFSDADKLAEEKGTSSADIEKWQSGIPTAALEIGDRFTLDGQNWIVLGKDSSNNLLISTTKAAYKAQANPPDSWKYSGSILERDVLNFYNTKLPTLNPYAKKSTTNIEGYGTTAGGYTLPANNMGSGNTDGLAKWLVSVKLDSAVSKVTEGAGSKAFVLSASDLNVLADNYPGGRTNFAADYMVNGEAFWLRSRGNAFNATARAAGSGVYNPATVTWANSAINDSYSNTSSGVRPALWVNFNN